MGGVKGRRREEIRLGMGEAPSSDRLGGVRVPWVMDFPMEEARGRGGGGPCLEVALLSLVPMTADSEWILPIDRVSSSVPGENPAEEVRRGGMMTEMEGSFLMVDEDEEGEGEEEGEEEEFIITVRDRTPFRKGTGAGLMTP